MILLTHLVAVNKLCHSKCLTVLHVNLFINIHSSQKKSYSPHSSPGTKLLPILLWASRVHQKERRLHSLSIRVPGQGARRRGPSFFVLLETAPWRAAINHRHLSEQVSPLCLSIIDVDGAWTRHGRGLLLIKLLELARDGELHLYQSPKFLEEVAKAV